MSITGEPEKSRQVLSELKTANPFMISHDPGHHWKEKLMAMKSIGAGHAGFVAIFVLSAGTDAILEATGAFPPFKVQFEQNYYPARGSEAN